MSIGVKCYHIVYNMIILNVLIERPWAADFLDSSINVSPFMLPKLYVPRLIVPYGCIYELNQKRYNYFFVFLLVLSLTAGVVSTVCGIVSCILSIIVSG